ncbi:biotin synthase domain protein [Enterobacter hormaechei subsp. xiangfangensis]|nr:biotin synthase domain protein [Enterobacter hormaechei subsp. xiangfangensis]
MSEQTQAMCFMAGANSIFYGCKLLPANPEEDKDVHHPTQPGAAAGAADF